MCSRSLRWRRSRAPLRLLIIMLLRGLLRLLRLLPFLPRAVIARAIRRARGPPEACERPQKQQRQLSTAAVGMRSLRPSRAPGSASSAETPTSCWSATPRYCCYESAFLCSHYYYATVPASSASTRCRLLGGRVRVGSGSSWRPCCTLSSHSPPPIAPSPPPSQAEGILPCFAASQRPLTTERDALAGQRPLANVLS